MHIWIKESKDTIVLIPVVDSRFLFRLHLYKFKYNMIPSFRATIYHHLEKKTTLCKFRMERQTFL